MWFEKLIGRFVTIEKKYSIEEVAELVEKIKTFNAGVIDEHLNKHVDHVFKEWAENHK